MSILVFIYEKIKVYFIAETGKIVTLATWKIITIMTCSATCIDASDICIPKTGTVECHDKNIPGWSDHVEELRRDSLMWNQHWRECGQPHHSPVSEIQHLISRAHYHKAVRYVIKNSDRIRTEKMAEAIADNRTRDIFKEARKIKGRYNAKPGNVDGCTGDKNISNLFVDKYSN